MSFRSARGESGFTLIEVLVALVIGLVIFTAAMGLLEAAARSHTRISDRVDSNQRGRNAMEQIVQQVRSQVCLGSQPPILSGDGTHTTDGTQLWFRADLRSASPMVPDMRELIFDSTARTITEKTWIGAGAAPGTTYAALPTKTRILIDNVDQIDASTPVFRYYTYNGGAPSTPTMLLAAPLSSSDAGKVSAIGVDYAASPTHATTPTTRRVNFSNVIYVRLADATTPTLDPQCQN